jgi:hypothetical protein
MRFAVCFSRPNRDGFFHASYDGFGVFLCWLFEVCFSICLANKFAIIFYSLLDFFVYLAWITSIQQIFRSMTVGSVRKGWEKNLNLEL